MPDDPAAPNSLGPNGRNRSVAEGDVPEILRRRYYVDGRGGAGLGFYVDAKVKAPAFRDRGRQLVTVRSDPRAVHDMVAVAQHRGWSTIVARGEAGFRREAWLAGRTLGIEVRGYRPTERDLQDLERRTVAHKRSGQGREDQPQRRDQQPRGQRDLGNSPGVRSRLRVVEAVVRARITDGPPQERIIAAARTRISDWLERGAGFTVPPLPERSAIVEAEQDPGRRR